MLLKDFFYELPEELIAQHPEEQRENSRLLIIERETGKLTHKHFYNIIDYLNEGDTLILNNTKVIPARLFGHKKTIIAKQSNRHCEQSEAIQNKISNKVEFLLLKQISIDTWECLAKPGKKAKEGSVFVFGECMIGTIVKVLDNGNRIIKFEYDTKQDFYKILDKIGSLPLPHYIKEKQTDNSRYQTVYAKENGSAAAPTAGLHFTDELLENIKNKGVNIGYVTLHVGLGTFRPVKTENITDHTMHSESYYLPQETADLINYTKKSSKNIICVGTTSCRTLECVANATENDIIKESSDETNIFIYPGYKFKCMDGLITNFHLPESTLIMLVSAFAGHYNTMSAYKEAVRKKYRFYSFGDAMLII